MSAATMTATDPRATAWYREQVAADPASAAFAVVAGHFPPDLCDRIMAEADRRPHRQPAAQYGQPSGDHRFTVAWEIGPDDLAHPLATAITEHLTAAITSANNAYWRYDVETLAEITCQTYDAPDGGIAWHVDRHPGRSRRKLSLVVMLSDPGGFTGGAFQIKIDREDREIRLNRGDVLVFPSWLCHRVAPVLTGRRATLVTWVHGPTFR